MDSSSVFKEEETEAQRIGASGVTSFILSSPFSERKDKQSPFPSVSVYLGGWGDVLMNYLLSLGVDP